MRFYAGIADVSGNDHKVGVIRIPPFQGLCISGGSNPGLRCAPPWAGFLRPFGAEAERSKGNGYTKLARLLSLVQKEREKFFGKAQGAGRVQPRVKAASAAGALGYVCNNQQALKGRDKGGEPCRNR